MVTPALGVRAQGGAKARSSRPRSMAVTAKVRRPAVKERGPCLAETFVYVYIYILMVYTSHLSDN